jgi:phosphoribosyl 1,2-cyclic phosphodiesterase
MESGINIYSSKGTIKALKLSGHRIFFLQPLVVYGIGSFKVMPFLVKHDAKEPFGYLIDHPEMGRLMFCTDTYYVPFKFKGMNHILVECNYAMDIADDNIEHGAPIIVRNRVLESHMELSTVKTFLHANDLRYLQNIVLLHLSSGNSDAKRFKLEIEAEAPGKNVFIADSGMTIPVNLYPF